MKPRVHRVAPVLEAKERSEWPLYLGHKNIQHTVRYTELAAGRFKDFWKN